MDVHWERPQWCKFWSTGFAQFVVQSPPFALLLLLLLLSRFSRVQLYATLETAAHQASPSLGFSRQEHWSGLPFPSPMHEGEKWKGSRSVVSKSSRPHGLQPTRLLRLWDFPGRNGVGCHCLLRYLHYMEVVFSSSDHFVSTAICNVTVWMSWNLIVPYYQNVAFRFFLSVYTLKQWVGFVCTVGSHYSP